MVPDWFVTGVVVMFFNSYQRAPSRPPEELAAPLELTCMLCTVQRRPLCIFAQNSRSSTSSKGEVLPKHGTPPSEATVGDTVTLMLAEMDGVPPGLVMRRTESSL